MKYGERNAVIRKYDYSYYDSLFYSSKIGDPELSDSLKNIEKRVDSKLELLDFSSDKKANKKYPTNNLKYAGIDINSASLQILAKLPGIGPKTAQKIDELRKKKGKFKTLDELLEVKGIGKVKFEKIKKYLFIGN